MVVDHEAVVADLTAFIAEKPHHGTKDLLAEVARLLATHRVNLTEPGVVRMLRLYEVEVHQKHLSDDSVPQPASGSSADPMEQGRHHQLT